MTSRKQPAKIIAVDPSTDGGLKCNPSQMMSEMMNDKGLDRAANVLADIYERNAKASKPEILAQMPADKFRAGMVAIMKLALIHGRASLAANPGLAKRH